MQKLVALGCEFSPIKTQDDMVWVRRVPVARPEPDEARRVRGEYVEPRKILRDFMERTREQKNPQGVLIL